jgi:hypothetical protein
MRKIISAALALTVAGGVYLAGQPAEASNMGFKLERSLDLIRDVNNRPHGNLYYVSFPLFNGLGDVANSAPTPNNKCVGDPTGPPAGDNVINADDAICDLWTSRQGDMAFTYIDRDTCSKRSRTATNQGAIIGIRFSGAYTDVLTRDVGYAVNIGSAGSTTLSPQNRAVIVGSHDPSYAGRQILFAPGCGPTANREDLLNLPYHTMYQFADEILCGLENVDWVDANGDGKPDTCDPARGAIFDGQTGQFHGLSVTTFDNDANTFVSRVVTRNALLPPPGLVFTNTNFDLRPGDAYLLNLSRQHVPTTFLSPHF